MYDFNTLVEEILRNRPELDKEKLGRLIEEKKSNVGAGYLTDQGALFLIAGELGIRLKNIVSADLTLKDLYIGANDITIVARILAIYPIKEYRRKDGTTGRYRRVKIFDKNGVARLTLWDNVELIEQLGVKIGAPIRIVNGYVKQGLDGKPDLNLGKRGRIEILEDKAILSKMVTIEELERKVKISDQDIIAITGTVSSESRTSNFTRNDGSQGRITQFKILSENGQELRVVIWDGINLPEVKTGTKVRIVNLKMKQQYGGQELHGDAGSTIEVLGRVLQKKTFLLVCKDNVNDVLEMLVVDRTKSVYQLDVKDAKESLDSLKYGDQIEVIPDEESDNKIVCSKDSVTVKFDRVLDIEALFTKVNKVKESAGAIMLEVISLSKSTLQEVYLKDGSKIMKGELIVGDDTGEVKVVGWRELAEKLNGIEPGERLRILGVIMQASRMNVKTLQLTHFSKIEKR
jgi:replication factor A1